MAAKGRKGSGRMRQPDEIKQRHQSKYLDNCLGGFICLCLGEPLSLNVRRALSTLVSELIKVLASIPGSASDLSFVLLLV